ncbi:MAG: hypothetical protein MIO93_14780, partial [ANME-2 cluster archaeon]|nr:hypothetical protein [ANME-2 cluster archaeon]
KYKTIVFIALLITSAFGVSNVRHIKDNTIKSVMYLLIGFTVFWIVGATYTGSYLHLMLDSEKNQFFMLFTSDFIPVSLFAIANTITVLVALVDGRKNGIIFGSMGIGAIMFPIALMGMKFVGSNIDKFLILAVLWAFIPTLWVRLLTPIINNPSLFSVEKRLFKVLKSSIPIALIYITIGLLTCFVLMDSSIPYETFSISTFFEDYGNDLKLFALVSGYYFILPNVILITGIFPVYEFALLAFNVKREVARDGTFVYITEKKNEDKPAAKKEYDPFEDIIKEMKDFKKEFGKGKINRIMAAQKIGTLREQVDFLNSKYDIGSKAKAGELLKQIERESEFAFK